MRIVDLIMRFEAHSKNARNGAEKDVSDYFPMKNIGNPKNVGAICTP